MQYSALPGWFAYERLYDHAISVSPNDGKLVEVGCWFGRGLVYLAQAAKSVRLTDKELKVYGVIEPTHSVPMLLDNLNQCDLNLSYDVTVLPMWSADGAKFFDNKSLSFVFLDRTIKYSALLADIELWSKKIAPGGILAGAHYADKRVAAAIAAVFNIDCNYDCPVCPSCWMVCL